MEIDLHTAAAVDIAAAIRARKVSPLEVVDAHIARIEAVNPALNALIADRYEEARAEAADATDLLMREDAHRLPPFLGVPCTAKEYLEVVGMPNTGGGLLSRKGLVGQRNAVVVERMRKAGAIVLGVSNTPEGGMWMETYNKIFGRTNNPYDLSRTPGGSSGGEAALVAAGASPIGLAADIAGSIRIPAAFCGVVGHKPTSSLIPTTGHWQPSEGGTSEYLTCGPITRRVRDLDPLLSVLAGPDGEDSHAREWALPEYRSDLKDVIAYVVDGSVGAYVHRAARDAVESARQALQSRGVEVRPLRSRAFSSAFLMWTEAMTDAMGEHGAPSFAEILGDGAPISLLGESLRSAIGRSSVTFPALALAVLDNVSSKLPRIGRPPDLREMRLELEATLGDRGVLLHPPYTRPAPRHNRPLLTPFDFVCSGVMNVLKFPVTQVPVGFHEGIPVGVQVVGARGMDRLTISVAAALEEDLGGWVPPALVA